MELKRPEDALALLDEVMALDPNFFKAYNNKGTIYFA